MLTRVVAQKVCESFDLVLCYCCLLLLIRCVMVLCFDLVSDVVDCCCSQLLLLTKYMIIITLRVNC